MFGKNKAGTDSPAPDPMPEYYAQQGKLAEETSKNLAHERRELNTRAMGLASTEMKLIAKYEEFEKFVHGRLDEFRADLDLMAKFQGMYFDTIPAKRALMSIDGPDPRKVAQARAAEVVAEHVSRSVEEMLEEHSDDIDERITALVGRFNDLADLINNIIKKKR